MISWTPFFNSLWNIDADPFDYEVFGTLEGWTNVLFTMHPSGGTLSVEEFTAHASYTLTGGIVFTIWTLPGPTDVDLIVEVHLTGIADPFESFVSLLSGKIPVANALPLVDDAASSTYSLTNPLGGLCISVVASTPTFEMPDVTFPGDVEIESTSYGEILDPTGTMYAWASDLPGPFEIDGADIRRVVLFGAPGDSWHVGGVGRSW